MKHKLLIIGSGGHASSVIDAVEEGSDYEIIGLIDDFKEIGDRVGNYEVLGKIEDIVNIEDFRFLFVAIGDNKERNKIMHTFGLCNFAKIIHPTAYVSKSATTCEGVYIGANATVNANCFVSVGCIVNTNASLDHDSEMKPFSSLNPNSATGGKVKIGKNTTIGMGANIRNGITIGDNCFIRMGTTVINSVADNQKV